MGCNIKDIYAGKLDARFEDISLFQNNNMSLPPSINIDEILKGDKYYILGNKGTGKTALLLYISNYLTQSETNAICSTILFKTDYNRTERFRMESFERRVFDTLDMTDSNGLYMLDYTNIWLLTIFVKIVIDNKNNNYSIFKKSTNWDAFEDLVLRLSNTAKLNTIDKLALINRIPKTITFDDTCERIYVSEETISIPQNEYTIALIDFNKAITIASYLFTTLEQQNASYFICIDELEAYYGSSNFKRDLQMIHDWIEVVGQVNDLIHKSKFIRIKVILSVRTEILRTIEKHICGNEINKKIDSYKILLDWKSRFYSSTSNPLFLIWLKRIANLMNVQNPNYLSIREEMFPPTIGTEDTVDFILKRTWQKPRDIIRLISLSVAAATPRDQLFSKEILLNILDDYSSESKAEIIEEMSAFYSNEDIDLIFSSLKNYKIKFSAEEFTQHINENYNGYELFNNVDSILSDLYRYGVLGCINVDNNSVKWQYLGDINIMKGVKWKYYVHPGLWYCLELEKLYYDNINIFEIKEIPLKCIVTGMNKSFVYVSFDFNNCSHKGVIYIGNLSSSGEYISDITDYVQLNQIITAYVDYFDELYNNWQLTCRKK